MKNILSEKYFYAEHVVCDLSSAYDTRRNLWLKATRTAWKRSKL